MKLKPKVHGSIKNFLTTQNIGNERHSSYDSDIHLQFSYIVNTRRYKHTHEYNRLLFASICQIHSQGIGWSETIEEDPCPRCVA